MRKQIIKFLTEAREGGWAKGVKSTKNRPEDDNPFPQPSKPSRPTVHGPQTSKPSRPTVRGPQKFSAGMVTAPRSGESSDTIEINLSVGQKVTYLDPLGGEAEGTIREIEDMGGYYQVWIDIEDGGDSMPASIPKPIGFGNRGDPDYGVTGGRNL